MSQPTREEFERLEEEQRQLKEEVRKLKEQQTEPIKITRLEIDTSNMHKRLDEVQENTNISKIQMEGARADLYRLGESQADLRDRLIEHGQRLESIEQKQNTHTEILGQLMNFVEPHNKRFDRIEDAQVEHTQRFSRIEDAQVEHTQRFSRIEDAQAEHTQRFDRLEAIMLQILNRLPKAEGE